MKKYIKSIFVIALILNICCNSCLAKKVAQQRTMLETREIQTRYYETPDTFEVAKAVINTLQDNGFIIQNIEPELGYIRAKKEVKLKRTLKGRVTLYSTALVFDAAALGLSFGLNPSAMIDMYTNSMRIKNEVAPHTVIYDTNIVLERVGKRTKVRFFVIEKVLENADGYTTVKSSPRKVVRHYEQDIYQEFFNQVDKNLFIEKI